MHDQPPKQPRKRRKRGLGPEPMRAIRMSDEDWNEIRRRADAAGVSASEYLRARALGRRMRR